MIGMKEEVVLLLTPEVRKFLIENDRNRPVTPLYKTVPLPVTIRFERSAKA